MKLPKAYLQALEARKVREDTSSKGEFSSTKVLKLLQAIDKANTNSRSIKWSGLDKRTIDLHEWQAIVKIAQSLS